MIVECSGEQLILCKEKAIYWEREKMLIISDLHIGKSAHFRKSGIQVPVSVGLTDLQRISCLIGEYGPDILLVTGDMFHNKMNSDAEIFLEWRKGYPALKVVLIKGNHDALRSEDYAALDITVFKKELLMKPFRFIHDKPKEFDEYYNISGHIHPGVVIYGKARQQLKFPCFYFSDTCAVLPAFSVFTGLFLIKAEPGDRFYAVTPGKVVKV
ncbi:MAG: ligase-associated DNA damage response endonuclease PdeM [Bacteroidota bacterium]